VVTRLIRSQLIIFAVLTLFALVVLGWYYLRLPSQAGLGRYTLTTNLPASGGLYRTSNVTYRGVTIGMVTDVEPTKRGVQATLSIDTRFKIPVDASANVHSVSAVGEQYIDLVSDGNPAKYFEPGQTITKATVPSPIGPTLDAVDRGLTVLPHEKIASLLDETSQAVGGLGPTLHRLVDSTQALAGDFKSNMNEINDIIGNAAPIIDSQVNSSNSIKTWASNLNTIAAQTADRDQQLDSILSNAAPTADQANDLLSNVRESLPQTLANLEIVLDMLKRYHSGVEQLLVILPQASSIIQTLLAPTPGYANLAFNLSINDPPPCLTGFLPASEWRSPADMSPAPLPKGTYCKIPKDSTVAVRGARNLPCVDVPGKRAATPTECRSNKPYVPLGTNPWYGDPNQIVGCPAPAARCDQGVDPGRVIPAPSVNNGMNPAPANLVPQPYAPTSDPLSPPGQGSVTCSGQQPNPCTYTPSPVAIFNPQSGQLVGPDGVKWSVGQSPYSADDGWKGMLAPAS
jgi:phospholipid/cholesterol/gamma-HCH transport system substrate-binding protein